ncbi:MAG: molecular chaperone TorD family protein [Thermodesulfobacteriota bacterium]|nr:MAG: molecular chaperone TorD family protein [Thermodesulfobacteriota bacterium]
MDSTEKQSSKDMADHRSNIYGLLALVYRQEVTPDLLHQVKDPRFLRVFTDLGVEGVEAFLQNSEEKLIEDLAVEYARLFLGPGKHISPHESVHHQREDGDWGTLWGASTVDVKKFIEATGLGYEAGYKGMPDHISVEFEFMAALARREVQAWFEGDEASARSCVAVQKKFLEEHLIQWIPDFCEKVIRHAELPFYRAVAELTRGFIEFEIEELNRNGNKPNPV